MRCRRGGCDSMTAVVMKIPGPTLVNMYRCTDCNYTWGLNVGGPAGY